MNGFLLFCLLLDLVIPSFTYAFVTQQVDLPYPRKTNFLSTKKLTLRDAILLSLRMNPNVRSAEIQRVEDKFSLEVARNAFEPQYTLTASSTYAAGSTPAYGFNPGVTLTMSPGTQINTQFATSLQSGTTALTTTVTQHLLKGFGPTVTLAPLVLANYTETQNRLNLKNTVMTQITQTIQAYYNLVEAYNALTINELALENSLTTLQQYKIKIKAGVEAPMSVVEQESQVASQKLSVTQAHNAIQQAYQALLTQLGVDPNSKLEIDKTISINDLRIPNVNISIEEAMDNNLTYLTAFFGVKQAEMNLITAEDAQKWTLDVTATKVIGTNSGTTVSATTPGGTTITGAPSADSVALNLSVPIHNLSQQNQLVQAKVSLQQQRIALQSAKRDLETNVINAIQTLQFQQQQIVLAQNAVTLAQQSLDVELKKLQYGRSTLFEVTQLRSSLTSTQLNLISQQISYINNLAAYEQIVGTTLDKWGVQIYY